MISYKEKKKTCWQLGEVELNALESVIFRNMLKSSIGRKTIADLKDIGTVKAKRNGGLMVESNVSQARRASLLFSSKWGKYEYRCAMFFANPKEKIMGLDD